MKLVKTICSVCILSGLGVKLYFLLELFLYFTESFLIFFSSFLDQWPMNLVNLADIFCPENVVCILCLLHNI